MQSFFKREIPTLLSLILFFIQLPNHGAVVDDHGRRRAPDAPLGGLDVDLPGVVEIPARVWNVEWHHVSSARRNSSSSSVDFDHLTESGNGAFALKKIKLGKFSCQSDIKERVCVCERERF